MKITMIKCDRCKKEIKYIGWTAKITPNPLKRFKITKIYNGNPSENDYLDDYVELCQDCTKELKKWLKGEDRWFNVKDQLPSESEEYLTIYANEDGVYVNYFDNRRKEFNSFHEEVVAWAYIPKRIKE